MSTEPLILIVDDRLSDLKLLCRILRSRHYDLMVAQSGQSMLEKLNYVRPDLILLDVMLPDITGFELCKQLKTHPTLNSIAVIFLTALADTEHKVQGFQLGAVDYITKPFQQAEVISRIQRQIQLQQLTQALHLKNQQLLKEVQAREETEHQLHALTLDLEQQVMQRTAALREMVAQLQEQEQQLQYEATHDALTGLYNRAYLIQHLSRVLHQSRRDGTPYAILFVDLDHFKGVNDRLGHGTGDTVLRQVAQQLQKQVGNQGVVGRLGGDEFLIIVGPQTTEITTYFTGGADPTFPSPSLFPPSPFPLPQREQLPPISCDVHLPQWIQSQLLPLIHAILALFRQPFRVDSYLVTVSGSMGIVTQELGYSDVKCILRDVDLAMYQAKRSGSGRYLLLDLASRQAALDRISLETDLQQALSRGELRVFYQPIVCLQSLKLAGFEALVRWQHPQRGLLAPGLFVTIAEELGLIQDIDFWVLEAACQQFCHWAQDYPLVNQLFLSLNFSPYQLQDHGLGQRLKSVCDRWQFAPQTLKVEITESLFQQSPEQLQRIFSEIHTLGIQLCIDDFGTGYSSLSRLQTLPVNTLKIDKSFVWQLIDPALISPPPSLDNRATAAAESQATIIQTILTLAQGFNLETVAEGIETPYQLQQLQALGCTYGQGFLFGPPLAVDQAATLLSQQIHGHLAPFNPVR
ncbi:MAG: GGDEF/EAL domain-containing response regulator [Prochlorothrix sp.]